MPNQPVQNPTAQPMSNPAVTSTASGGAVPQPGMQPTNVVNPIEECVKKVMADNTDLEENDAQIKCKESYKPPVASTSTAVAQPMPTVSQECGQNNMLLKQEMDNALMKAAEIQKEVGDLKDVQDYISKIKEKLDYNMKSCWGTAQQIITPQPTVTSAVAPTAITADASASDVTAYYQKEMQNIINKVPSVENQITSLKELRTKIDTMIEELLNNKETIDASDFGGLVDEFNVKPNEITAGDVSLETTDKEIVKNFNGQDMKIKPGKDNVMMNYGGMDVKARQISVGDKIKIDDIELKAMPDKIKKKFAGNVNSAELMKENGKLVYNVKTEENRKLFGLFNIKAQTNSKFDATDENAPLLNEEKPWWFALSSGAAPDAESKPVDEPKAEAEKAEEGLIVIDKPSQ
jgi:uncharacterized membrane protein YkoI